MRSASSFHSSTHETATLNKVAVLLCLALLLFAPAFAENSKAIPGRSVGKIRLGSTYGSVRKIWGKPYFTQRKGSLIQEGWKIGNDADISAIFRFGKVIQIATTSGHYITPQGISVNSSLGTIRKRLGNMRVVSFGEKHPDPEVAEHAIHYYDDIKRGLAFELDMGAQANLAADVVPHSLIIHYPKRRVLHW